MALHAGATRVFPGQGKLGIPIVIKQELLLLPSFGCMTGGTGDGELLTVRVLMAGFAAAGQPLKHGGGQVGLWRGRLVALEAIYGAVLSG